MVDIKNIAKEKLHAGELAIGVGLRQARTVDIAKAMKTAGLDWLFIDMEHNSMNLDTATQISVTAQDVGITPLLRVPGFQHFHASRALDGGAQGIVVPHVDTKETAIQMVRQCKYPPIGHRSVAGAQPMLDFQSFPMAEATKAVNNATLTVLMLETPTAIRNANDIASVEGVDCLLIGTNPRFEASLLNVRLRKRMVRGLFTVGTIGLTEDLTYKSENLGVATENLVAVLEGKHPFC